MAMKYKFLNMLKRVVLTVLPALSFVACLNEEILEVATPLPQTDVIRFNIRQGWSPDVLTRSAADSRGELLSQHSLVSGDGSQALELSAYSRQNDTWFGVDTRGTMIQSDSFNEFMSFAYKSDGSSTTQMFNTHHVKNGSMWERPLDNNGNGYYWPGNAYSCSFFGIALSDNKLTDSSFYSNVETSTDASGQIVSFIYNVPDNAVDQPDIMVASATNLPGDGSAGANLNFNHILTAVNVKVGQASVGEDINSIRINSITFNNIYSKASYTIATDAWTNSVYFDVKKNFTVDFNGADAGNGTYAYSSGSNVVMNDSSATMMLLPQTLRNDATVTVSYTLIGSGINRNISSTANLGGTVWEAGKAVNYVLNIDNSDGVEFLTEDSYQDAHYVIVPLNVKIQNPGGTVSMRAIDKATGTEADWVQFRQSLVEVENDGWWADPSQVYNVDRNGNQTLVSNSVYRRFNSLTVNSAGQYFAFLTENIGDTDRQAELQLLIGGEVKDSVIITQLCPTWNLSGAKGCERIEEGEALPWGYNWMMNEGEGTYETVVTVTDFGTRIFATIINWLYGSPAEHQLLTNYYVFNYTTFINEMSDPDTGSGSTTNGLRNSTYMFSYSGGGDMLGFYSTLVNYLGGVVTSTTFDGIAYTEYATKEALKKNKVKVLIGTSSGESEHNPVIDANRTDLWYLPASEEVSALQNNTNLVEGVETRMNAGDRFWTSTAAVVPYSYVFTFGASTQLENRDNSHRVRAVRDIGVD